MNAERLQRFFADLRPRYEMAREMDTHLNRQLAYRFNVLDYIRTSELGLSRVIADLFNPKENHGQGTLFLDTFLRGLKCSSEARSRPLDLTLGYGKEWEVVDDTVCVRLERTIPSGRRLDISVEFKGKDGQRRCLAIENKPYAGDQDKQIHDYLTFMEKTYGRRVGNQPTNHLLIYLSPTGELPSESSVSKERLGQEIKERDFAVMGYSLESAVDSIRDESDMSGSALLLDYTLEKWFDECRRECEVEHLRNFLRDGKEFCGRRFGGVAVPDATRDQILQFLVEPDNMQIAAHVSDTVTKMRTRVRQEPFLQITKGLRDFRRDNPSWDLAELGKGQGSRQADRLVLSRKGKHWSSQWQNAGVWLHWMAWKGVPAWGVGVEGVPSPSDDEPSPLELDLRSCYPGGDTLQGGGNWFYGWPCGRDWVGWENLLARSDEDKIREFAQATVNLMTRLAGIIDKADQA